MAEAAAVKACETATCAFCTGRGDIKGYKAMPCSHIFCKKCLTQYYEHNDGLLKCPECRKEYAVEPDSLPSAHQMNQVDRSILCEVCIESDVDASAAAAAAAALMYCMKCEKRFCVQHTMDHDKLLKNHERLNIADYKRRRNKLKNIPCEKHPELPYSMGCANCVTPLCSTCICLSPSCLDGSTSHVPVTPEELVKKLIPVDKIKEKEKKLDDFYKSVSEVIDDFNLETDRLLNSLRLHRNSQPLKEQSKCNQLEKELRERRNMTAAKMGDFMVEDIAAMLTKADKKRGKIEAMIENTHQVKIVLKIKEILKDIHSVIDEKFPSLELHDVMTLKFKVLDSGKKEVVTRFSKERITVEHGPTFPPPKSIKLLQSKSVSQDPRSVYQHKGITYVGVAGGVDRLDAENVPSKLFIVIKYHNVISVLVHKDRIYVLSLPEGGFLETQKVMYGYDRTYRIGVYDLMGRCRNEWTNIDTGFYKQFCVVNDQLVIPDRKKNFLLTHSLGGEVVSSKPLDTPVIKGITPFFRIAITAMCSADTNSVIISCAWHSLVYRVNVSTGNTVWVYKDADGPEGVACYKEHYVFVSCTKSASKPQEIHVLSLEKGEMLTKIGIGDGGPARDLSISGNVLLVPREGSAQVQHYEIE